VCVELYFTVLGKEQYIERDDTVCVELYCTVLGKKQYIQREDTVCAEMHCNMTLCVFNCIVTL